MGYPSEVVLDYYPILPNLQLVNKTLLVIHSSMLITEPTVQFWYMYCGSLLVGLLCAVAWVVWVDLKSSTTPWPQQVVAAAVVAGPRPSRSPGR
jgi:hypothetical protein